MDTEREKEWKMHKYGEIVKKKKKRRKSKNPEIVWVNGWLLTEAGSERLEGPGQHGKYTESECYWEAGWHLVGYTSEKETERRVRTTAVWLKKKKVLCDELCLMPAASLQSTTCSSILSAFLKQLKHELNILKTFIYQLLLWFWSQILNILGKKNKSSAINPGRDIYWSYRLSSTLGAFLSSMPTLSKRSMR